MNLPSVQSARLPETYTAAKQALAECARIDECKTWQKKAEAMASYAKQAADESLYKLATKIKARAIDRCGALLREIESDAEAESRRKNGLKHRSTGADTTSNRDDAAAHAGLSKRQRVTALRVNNVPREDFERLVESDDPPTITELAEIGKKSRPTLEEIVDLRGRSREDVQAWIYGRGAVQRLAEFARDTEPASIARGADHKNMRKEICELARECRDWLNDLITELQ